MDSKEKIFDELFHEYYLQKVRSYLKPRDRELFDLWVIDELAYSEIAARLKIKEVSVRSRISRIRKRLDPHMSKIFNKK